MQMMRENDDDEYEHVCDCLKADDDSFVDVARLASPSSGRPAGLLIHSHP